MSQPGIDAIRNALLGVIDPELGDNVVDLGMVRNIEIDKKGVVTVEFALTVASCPLRNQLQTDLERQVGAVPDVTKVEIVIAEMNPEEKRAVMQRARWKARENEVATDIPPNTRIVAIASGKGGVGKSSVTVNIAAALAMRGFTVGILDADIWGFSVPRMLGLKGEVPVENKKMIPLEKSIGKGKLKVLSMGFLSNENEAIMWRGLILNRAVQHFLEDVRWGDMDYLLIDMPPGTGDIQMGLARMLPRTEMIVVTTPALAAQQVAARAADMAKRGYMRVAGIIENMSAFTDQTGEKHALFGEGGGQRLSSELGVPFLGSIPIDASVAAGGDAGEPAVLTKGSFQDTINAIVEKMVTEIVPPVEMSDCTARMIDAIEEATTAN
jgi:ATP-binding protein involved in chromosome partitioning